MTLRATLGLSPLLALSLVLACGGCRGSSHKHDHAADNGARGTSSPTSSGASSGGASSRPASTQPSSFTGTLRGGAVAIGGETTGWRLEGDGQTGGIELDVSRVRDRAKQLDGKRVTVGGRMTTRSWPERGSTQVLVVDRLEAAPVGPASPRPGTGGSR